MTTTRVIQAIEPRHYAATKLTRRDAASVARDPHPPACVHCKYHSTNSNQPYHTHRCDALYNVVTDEPISMACEDVRGDQELCARVGWFFTHAELAPSIVQPDTSDEQTVDKVETLAQDKEFEV